jgi:hypothetical protein
LLPWNTGVTGVEVAYIHTAVSKSKSLYTGEKYFTAFVERILRSYTTLQLGKLRVKPKAVADFSVDGVCKVSCMT